VLRAVTQQHGLVTVRAAVLADDESQRYFCVAFADEGIQAVWMSVKNASDALLYYPPVTTDPNYFTPPEAAQLFHSWWPGRVDTAIAVESKRSSPACSAPR
jgi:hypothetical protein